MVKNDKTKDEKQNEVSRKEIEVNLHLGVVLTLWGIAVAFAVQVVYDYVGSMLFTSVAKFYLGIVIIAILIGALLLYTRHLIGRRKGKKH